MREWTVDLSLAFEENALPENWQYDQKGWTVHPIVQSRNRTLDIIFNAKLGEAAEKGIAVEVLQADAPKSLPLSETELCALMMNLLDNAIDAACKADSPFLRLDMHQKDGFFVFVCENATTSGPPEKSATKEAAPQHGLAASGGRTRTCLLGAAAPIPKFRTGPIFAAGQNQAGSTIPWFYVDQVGYQNPVLAVRGWQQDFFLCQICPKGVRRCTETD